MRFARRQLDVVDYLSFNVGSVTEDLNALNGAELLAPTWSEKK